jgi:hypothetical protein
MTRSTFDQPLPAKLQTDARGAGFPKDGDTAGFKAIMIGYYSGRGIVIMANSDNGMSLALEIIRAVERSTDGIHIRRQ